jgi:hypothetical protein
MKRMNIGGNVISAMKYYGDLGLRGGLLLTGVVLFLACVSLCGAQVPMQTDVPIQTELPPDLVVRNQPLILRGEAYGGLPYGIGKITFRMRQGDQMIDRIGAAMLTDTENRVLYPVVTKSAVKTFFQSISGRRGSEPDDAHTLWFLFRGNAPLNLTIHGSDQAATVLPVQTASRQRQFDRTVEQWWRAFNRSILDQIEESDYPPMVETYLMSMLGPRMGLKVSDPFKRNRDPLMQTFELMFDVETLRSETIRNMMLYGVDLMPADQPVPNPIQWTPVGVQGLPAEVKVEPIASCVPEECFYLRFGTWDNQLWLQSLMEEFGGDLSQMIQVRGFKYKIQSKFLNQLAIQSSEWDRLFGGNLIDDVAVIGTDTYFDNGSAVGVLLHAKATERLKTNLRSKRQKFVDANQDIQASLKKIDFGGDTIEFLSTPDNRYRSFYAVSGDCHLMTTSLVVAKRFLEAGRGIRSLADSKEFQFARFNMPLERDDTVFIYLSTPFFQNLLTPQYQIELKRRNRIVTDMMVFELAHLAATNEGHADKSIEGLIAGGYLPRGFRHRADGGSFELINNRWHDSVRGRRGFFAPIPDLPLEQVSREEVAWFQSRASFFSQSIRSLDPMFIAIKRYQHRDKVERVVFDARVAPFGEEKYGWLMSMLGPPLRREVAAAPDDIVRLQASMKGGNQNPEIASHQIFAAVQDRVDPSVSLEPKSIMRMIQALRETPGYIGAWPSAGFTDWMPALGGVPDQFGYTYSRILKLWKLQWDGFSVLSFDRNRLESLKGHLRIVDSERPAHVRLTVGDLGNSKLREWANSINYRRGWQTSVANVQLLNLLTQQFRVAPEEANSIVERMLDVELVCSLGGEYELVQLPTGRKLWHSTAWPSFLSPQLPAGHVAPLLKWFRGLQLEVSKADSQFSVHGFIDVERSVVKKSLPSFDMFKGFQSLFGGAEKENQKSKQ